MIAEVWSSSEVEMHTHTHTHGKTGFNLIAFFALLFVFIMSNSSIYAQNPCVYDVTNSNLLLNKYIPDSNTPIKTIHLSFHVWRNDNGTGNFWQNSQAYRDTLRMVVGFLNWIYTENVAFSDPISNAVFISDTKVRFELDSIYYYDNTVFSQYGFYNDIQEMNDFINANYPERTNSFLYHLTLDNSYPPAWGFSSGAFSEQQYILTYRQRPIDYQNNDGGMFFMLALHMAHEFGHNFNLNHTYNSEIIGISNPEFLWDLFGAETENCIIEVCDMFGRNLFSQKVNQKEGEIIIETKSFISGNYFVYIQSEGKRIKIEKISINN